METTNRVNVLAENSGSLDVVGQSEELAKGERITVNMCVVSSNYASVGEFPALLLPVGAQQLGQENGGLVVGYGRNLCSGGLPLQTKITRAQAGRSR